MNYAGRTMLMGAKAWIEPATLFGLAASEILQTALQIQHL